MEENLSTKENLEFLSTLDSKLHKTQTSSFTPNMNGRTMKVCVDQYTNAVLTPEETQKLLNILETNDFVLYPINTCMGFAVGFEVANIEVCGQHCEARRLLTFKESQLPAGYDFARLSEVFMKNSNLERAIIAGIKIVNDHTHYEY